MRHESSLINHRSSKRITKELESTTEKLKHRLSLAHRLLGNHHVRTVRRHKATKGSLSLLKRQQMRARRQRLALKKQLRRAAAHQSLVERKMERLHHILDVVLQVNTDCTVTYVLRLLSPFVCVYVCLYVCLSISLFVCLCMFVCLCVCAHKRISACATCTSVRTSFAVGTKCGTHIMLAHVFLLLCTMHAKYFTQ